MSALRVAYGELMEHKAWRDLCERKFRVREILMAQAGRGEVEPAVAFARIKEIDDWMMGPVQAAQELLERQAEAVVQTNTSAAWDHLDRAFEGRVRVHDLFNRGS